ncbi:MAG: hypothetical protein K8L99_02480 [Anaerolineae bacterium]|nr:hypothetical protein [Anaerolineae bacterium]
MSACEEDGVDVGDLVEVRVTFANKAGDLVDPSNVQFRYYEEGGSEVTKSYGSDDEVEKESLGVFLLKLTIPSSYAGKWVRYRGEGTGTVIAAAKGKFYVLEEF